MELIENLHNEYEYGSISLFNVKKSRGRPKKIKDETEIIEKKPRGRPKKIIDETETEIIEIIPKQRGRPRKETETFPKVEETETFPKVEVKHFGRPKKYNSYEELLQAKRTNGRLAYDGKGKIYLKILSFKKNYNINLNTEDIKNKSQEELTEILLSISNKIEEIKKEKHNEYINRLKNKINKLEMKDDFKPKSKYLTF